MRRVLLHTLLMVLLITAVMIAFLSMTQLARSDTALDVPEATLQALAAYLNPTGDEFFSVEGEIGRAVPRRIVYSAEAELFAVVDAYNTLLLMDATTYATRFTLEPYPNEDGGYNIIDMRFSHDGRYLAFLTDKNVELWDTQTGARAASLRSPATPKRLLGPLAFSSHDDVLIFYGEYAAPPSIRQSENDSVFYPWVWHLGAARGETPSTLPGGVESQLMFDYGLGFALTPQDSILAVLPSRLVVLDALTLEPEYEIPTTTYADDALTVYTSTDGQRMYVRAGRSGDLMRVDSEAQTTTLFSSSRGSRLSGDQAAGARSIPRGALFDRLLGTSLAARTRGFSLIDFVQPLDPTLGGTLALIHITTSDGNRHFTLVSGENVSQMTVSPDQRTLLTRESSGGEVIAVYDIESGERRYSLTPSLRGSSSYSRAQQNRVLAFDGTGDTFLSDFQRFNAETVDLLAEDLRYSFSFDRFYFGRDPGTMVTISGTEWRMWDIATNTVLRREVLTRGSSDIYGISRDAHRIVFWYDQGAVVQDFDTDTTYRIPYPQFTTYGLSRSSSYLNPSWTRMVTVYSDHPTGMYAPGGAIALTEPDQAEPLWLIAGDDLPPIISQVGWIDDDTIYVSGGAASGAVNERVFGVDYAPSGLPACIESRYPEQRETFLRLWERRLYFIPMDDLNRLALDLCAATDLSGDQVVATLAVTPTPTATLNPYATLAPNTTPITAGQPPPCLFDLYTNPDERDAYIRLWQELSAAVPLEAQNELIAVICERVGSIRVSVTAEGDGSSVLITQVMWIDAETGVRSIGSLPATRPPSAPTLFNPTDLIVSIYRAVTERQPTGALMSDDRRLLAVSNLPGELTIYRLNFDHTRAGIPGTATAIAARTAQNLIYPAVTEGVSIIPTATPYLIGTARPTLTITPSQTVFPLPSDEFTAETQQICTRTLFTADNLPPDYAAAGRIYGTFGDTGIWGIEPEDGSREPDEDAPLCGYGLNCQFSPDRAWILAQTYELVYVTRPDNSDQRVLWDLRTPNPPTPFPQNLHWAAPNMLEWNDMIEVGATPTHINVIVRDVLNVYPDPALLPSTFSLRVNEIPARVVAQQPGGLWVVLETTYGTGTGYGYRYYLHRLGTDEIIQFVQHPEFTASFRWVGYGERVYYHFNIPNSQPPEYEVLIPTGETHNARLEAIGAISPDGTRGAYIFDTQMFIQEIETGAQVVYCLPNINSQSSPLWSPDGRYLTWIGLVVGDEEEHLFVFDSQTGSTVDLVRGIFSLITWGQEPGSYGSGAVMTPAPERDGFPTPTPPGGGA